VNAGVELDVAVVVELVVGVVDVVEEEELVVDAEVEDDRLDVDSSLVDAEFGEYRTFNEGERGVAVAWATAGLPSSDNPPRRIRIIGRRDWEIRNLTQPSRRLHYRLC